MDDDSVPAPQGGDRYRDIASSLRALVPTMKNEEVRVQLSMLALEYEKLAHCRISTTSNCSALGLSLQSTGPALASERSGLRPQARPFRAVATLAALAWQVPLRGTVLQQLSELRL